jgi:hypothetical protein
MEIEFHGTYSRQDLFRAVFLANKPSRRQLLVRIGVAAAAIILYFFVFILASIKVHSPIFDGNTLGRHIFTLVLVALFLVYPSIITTLTAAKLWRDPIFRKPFSGTISEEGIQYTGKKTLLVWDRFKKRKASADLIALLTTDGILCFFPRRFFKSEGDWARVNQLANFQVIDIVLEKSDRD